MKRFEYCLITYVNGCLGEQSKLITVNGKYIDLTRKELVNVLNDLGKDGWEMTGSGVEYGSYSHTLYFKREIQSKS